MIHTLSNLRRRRSRSGEELARMDGRLATSSSSQFVWSLSTYYRHEAASRFIYSHSLATTLAERAAFIMRCL